MRDLSWNGGRNLRDLGGLPTPLARTGSTRQGRVARGGRRETLTADGWDDALTWGLRSVVDLRNADEMGQRSTDPGATEPPSVTIRSAPTEDEQDPEFRRLCMPILDSPEYWRHNVGILPHLVRDALEAVASSEPGVLVHCAAGRDRTGMITVLLLAEAEVPMNHILLDHAAAVRATAGLGGHGDPSHDRIAGWTSAQVDGWLVETLPHVQEFAADRDAVFAEVGVDTATRRELRSLLTR